MRKKEVPKGFKVMDGWEELGILLQSVEKDLKKAITKGTKRSGVNARHGLMYAKELITNIYHASWDEQQKVRSEKPEHKNKMGPGIKKMNKYVKQD